MKIGIIPEAFRLPRPEGIRRAAELGADGIQLYATHRGYERVIDYEPSRIDELKACCREAGMVFSALCADVGGHDFQITGRNLERAALTCRVVDLAVRLGAPVVTTHIGLIPEDADDPVYANMLQAVRRIAGHAAGCGVTLAIETGPEPAETLRRFLEAVDSPGVGVNLDPANFAMVLAYDPVRAVEVLGPWIVHTHAKDGIQLRPGDPRRTYGMADPDGGERVFEAAGPEFREVPLGTGQVPWDAYLTALRRIGYDGFLTIERECGDQPEVDIAGAVDFLRRRING